MEVDTALSPHLLCCDMSFAQPRACSSSSSSSSSNINASF